MVKVEKEICGTIPRMMRLTRFFCDKCDTECYPDGSDDEKLYEIEGQQLCFRCLMKDYWRDVIMPAADITEVTE